MARKPILRITEGPQTGKEFAVYNAYVIGRGEDCEINTGDPTTSRRHAQITIEKDGYRIVDLDSANGMLANKRKVKSHFIHHGDTIKMGETSFLVEFIVDPKERRRKFIVFIAIMVVALGSFAYYMIQQQAERIRSTTKVSFPLDTNYSREDVGFSLSFSRDFDVTERNHLPRPWENNLWGAVIPQVGNGYVTEKAVLDGYFNLKLFAVVDEPRWEFVRFDVDVCTGLPSGSTIYDFSLTDPSLPNALPLEFRERDVELLEHPQYGKYEEGTQNIPTGMTYDSDGTEITFWAKRRVYVVGSRRYALTFQTNFKMLARTQELMDELFDKFVIDIDKATAQSSRSDQSLHDEARRILTESHRLEQSAINKANLFKAYLRYAAASRLLQQMAKPSVEQTDAMKRVTSIQSQLQDELRMRRDRVRDNMIRGLFKEAFEALEDLETIVRASDDAYASPEKEGWVIWTELAQKFLVEEQSAYSQRLPR